MLDQVREDRILSILKNRYATDNIYTNVGPVLVAINPFKTIPALYTEARIREYHGKKYFEITPHVYALTDETYSNVLTYRENQCVIISGESGSGKTVTCKLMMQYISSVSGRSEEVQRVKERMLSSNPILEAFGNAKTVNNNNSSRFGKYIEILFNHAGDPVGGRVSNYLLEKSRVVGAAPNERSFHVFYQLARGASTQERQALYLEEPSYYRYLSASNCYTVAGIDDLADWKEVQSAFQTMGITDTERFELMRVLSVVLWLGQLDFDSNAQDHAVPSDMRVVEVIAELLKVKPEVIVRGLCVRTLTTGRGDTYQSPTRREEAEFTRDTLAKAMYSKMFEYLVRRTNESILPPSFDGITIGLLDIFGFEIFDQNSFEQLSINFVNERLQNIFIELTLKTEQEEYRSEGIPWTDVQFYNNKPVCELIEASPGIFPLLDDCCTTNKSESNFIQTLTQSLSSHPCMKVSNDGFTVKHYAGDVRYHAGQFVVKNKDTLFDDLVVAIQTSPCGFVKAHGWADMDVSLTSKRRPPTVGRVFRDQVRALMNALMACVPHYIRCIKPNHTKAAGQFDMNLVQRQVQYLGLLENVRVRRAGYAYRSTFDRFVRRYGILNDDLIADSSRQGAASRDGRPNFASDRERVLYLTKSLDWVEGKEYAMGKTKIFVREAVVLAHLEELLERRITASVKVIQNAYRLYLQKRKLLVLKANGYDALKHVAKERRRNSISREYYGDYAGASTSIQALGLMQQSSLKESVIFADRCQVVNVKERKGLLGRVFSISEDMAESRIILVSSAAVYTYVLAVEDKNAPAVARLFFRVPFAQITSISISPFSDNYVVLHFGPQAGVRDVLLRSLRKTELLGAIVHGAGSKVKVPINGVTTDQILVNAKKNTFAQITWEKNDMLPPGTVDKIEKIKQDFKISAPSGVSFSEVPEPYRPPEVDYATGGRSALRAIKDVEGNGVDELSFRKGQIIYVVRDEEKGWYQGELDGNIGFVPRHAVEVINSRAAIALASSSSTPSPSPSPSPTAVGTYSRIPPPLAKVHPTFSASASSSLSTSTSTSSSYSSPSRPTPAPAPSFAPPSVRPPASPSTTVSATSMAFQSPANFRAPQRQGTSPALISPAAPVGGVHSRLPPPISATASSSSSSTSSASSSALVKSTSSVKDKWVRVTPSSSPSAQLPSLPSAMSTSTSTSSVTASNASWGKGAIPTGQQTIVRVTPSQVSSSSPAPAPAAAHRPPPPPRVAPPPRWLQHVDPSSGNYYYEDTLTNTVQWDKPPGF